jgi:hypothetical protein
MYQWHGEYTRKGPNPLTEFTTRIQRGMKCEQYTLHTCIVNIQEFWENWLSYIEVHMHF